MGVPGETDLATMLARLGAERRPGVFTYAALVDPDPTLVALAQAVVVEDDLTTLVLPAEQAREAGLRVELELAWLTITVQSSLEAVGLTAAFARVLGEAGIPCNVLAGWHHDHVLVPVDRADEAIRLLTAPGPPGGGRAGPAGA